MSDRERTTDLRSRLPGVDIDDVTIRRLRQRVLDDISKRVASPERPVRVRRKLALGGIVGLAMLVVAAAGAAWFTRGGRSVSASRQAKAVPAQSEATQRFAAEVFTDDAIGARWSRRTSDGTEWILLSEGRFHIRIREHGPDRHVVVELPDGRIDDIGTVFDVEVGAAGTRRVAVGEGKVVVHVGGRSPLTLTEGHSWHNPDGGLANDVARPTQGTATERSTRRARRGDSEHRSAGAGAAPPGVNPKEHHAEDETYLDVLRLLHAERHAEAQDAARNYLRQFPDGFRREEMGVVIRSESPSR